MSKSIKTTFKNNSPIKAAPITSIVGNKFPKVVGLNKPGKFFKTGKSN